MEWEDKIKYIRSRRYHYLTSKHLYLNEIKRLADYTNLTIPEVKQILKREIEKEDMATYDLKNLKVKQIMEKYFITKDTVARRKLAYKESIKK